MGGESIGSVRSRKITKPLLTQRLAIHFLMSSESLPVYRGFYGGVKFMDMLSTVVQQRSSVSRQLIPTGINSVYSTDTTVKDRGGEKKFDADHLFEMLPDLVNPTFKAWYCKMFYALGKDRVLQLASLARQDGKDNRKYFSHLLKKAA